MQRLSTLDTSFLRVETPSAHMHVGWLATLELPDGVGELDPDELAERIAARLHLAPRFRQVVAPAPLGEPIWVDDPDFRLDRHVEVDAGAGAGAARSGATWRAASSLGSSTARSPLWQIVVVPRAGPGRAALIGKVHHAMVDGIAAVELGTLLFDLAPDAALPEPGDWEPGAARARRFESRSTRSPTARWSSFAPRGGSPRWGCGRARRCAWRRRCAAPRSRWPRT